MWIDDPEYGRPRDGIAVLARAWVLEQYEFYKYPEPMSWEEYEAWLHQTQEEREVEIVRKAGAIVEKDYYRKIR